MFPADTSPLSTMYLMASGNVIQYVLSNRYLRAELFAAPDVTDVNISAAARKNSKKLSR